MTTTANPTAPPQWEGVSAPKRALWRVEGIISRHRDFLIVSALLLIGLAVRLYVSRGLWLDEATTVGQAQMELGRMVSYMRESDVHPPLFQLIMWVDIRLFGTSEMAVRMPSMIAGTILVPLLYGAGRELFDRRTGLVAALVGAIGPATVWYSQEARMYPLFMVFALAAVWAQVVCVRRGGWKPWAAYTLATVALLWTQYFTVLHVLVQQVAFLVLIYKGRGTFAGQRLLAGYWRSTLAIFLMVAPLLSVPIAQIENYGDRNTESTPNESVVTGGPIYTAISNLASGLLGYHSESTMTRINSMWPFAMLAGLMALGRGRTRVTLLLTSLVLVPLAILFVVGLKRNDVFELRYFAGAVPVLALLVARAVVSLGQRSNKVFAALCVALTLTMSVALYDEQVDGGNARLYEYDALLTELNNQQQPGDLLLYEPFYLQPTVNYYASRFERAPLVGGLTSTTSQNRIILVDSLSFSDSESSRSRVNQVVERLSRDRQLVQHIQRKNIEAWVFQ